MNKRVRQSPIPSAGRQLFAESSPNYQYQLSGKRGRISSNTSRTNNTNNTNINIAVGSQDEKNEKHENVNSNTDEDTASTLITLLEQPKSWSHFRNEDKDNYLTKIMGFGNISQSLPDSRKSKCQNIHGLEEIMRLRIFSGMLDTFPSDLEQKIYENDENVIIKTKDVEISEIQNHMFFDMRQKMTGAPLFIVPLVRPPVLCNIVDQAHKLYYPNRLSLVLPVAAEDLLNYLQSIKYSFWEPENMTIRDEFALKIVQSVAFLHVNNFAHMDLKPENFLILAGNQLCLADFGNSFLVLPEFQHQNSSPSSPSKNEVGPINYTSWRSPNVVSVWYRPLEIACGSYNYLPFKVDIWSLGIILGMVYLNYRVFSEYIFESEDGDEAINTQDNIFNTLWETSTPPPRTASSINNEHVNDEKTFNQFYPFSRSEYEDSKKFNREASNKCVKDAQFILKWRNRGTYDLPPQDPLTRITKLFPPENIARATEQYGLRKLNMILNVIAKCLVLDVGQRTSNIFDILDMPLFSEDFNLEPSLPSFSLSPSSSNSTVTSTTSTSIDNINNPINSEGKSEFKSKSDLFRVDFITKYGCYPKTMKDLPADHFQWNKDLVANYNHTYIGPISRPGAIKLLLNPILWSYMIVFATVLGGRLNAKTPFAEQSEEYYLRTINNIFAITFFLFGINFPYEQTNETYEDTNRLANFLGNNLWDGFFLPSSSLQL